jgi:hypothetical protein
MNVPFYLVISAGGTVRAVKNAPGLRWDEVAIHMELEVPNAMFHRPLIEGKIIIDENAIAPREISPQVLINTAAEIERQTGMKVELKILPAEDTKAVGP